MYSVSMFHFVAKSRASVLGRGFGPPYIIVFSGRLAGRSRWIHISATPTRVSDGGQRSRHPLESVAPSHDPSWPRGRGLGRPRVVCHLDLVRFRERADGARGVRVDGPRPLLRAHRRDDGRDDAALCPPDGRRIHGLTRLENGQPSKPADVVGTVAFVVPYFLVWGFFGVAALVGVMGLGFIGSMLVGPALLVSAVTLFAAGIWQVTRTKEICLSHCT